MLLLLYFLRAMAWWGGVSGAARIFSHFTFSKSLSLTLIESSLSSPNKRRKLYTLFPLSSVFMLERASFYFNLHLHSSIFSESFSSTEYIIGRFFYLQNLLGRNYNTQKNYIVHIRSILDALSGRAVVLVTVFEVGRPLLKNSK